MTISASSAGILPTVVPRSWPCACHDAIDCPLSFAVPSGVYTWLSCITGNAGPPSASKFYGIKPWSYLHSNEYSYTRLIAHNASTMEWQQIANNDSRVIANLTITAESHGPFPTHHAMDEREA